MIYNTEPKEYLIKNRKGKREYFMYFNKTKPKKDKSYILDEDVLSKIYDSINSELVNKLLTRGKVRLPQGFGELMIVSYPIKKKINKEGKIETNAPINWVDTFKLWEEYPECKAKKQLVYMEVKEWYKISWKNCFIKNSLYYRIRLQRSATKIIRQGIKNGTLITYKEAKWNSM